MSATSLPVHPITGLRAIGIGKRGPIWPVRGGSVDTPSGTPAPESKPVKEFAPITSQEVLDHIISERLGREKAKYSDYEDMKTKADAYDKDQAEKLSEIQRAEKRAADAEADLATERIERLRLEVSAAKGVPAVLLTGSTKEEMEAAADGLISWRGEIPSAGKGLQPNPQQGTQSSSNKPSARSIGAAEAEKRFGKKPNQ
ncbi:hypothetical protein ACFXG4_23655 [Nocardia sp. NPDC059246]|uniref:hypothetical protein n=1 Tax=unclassified Nocardia TaxID=2637762 RepID=UPI0036C55DF7